MAKWIYLGPSHDFYEDAQAEAEGKAKHPGDTVTLTKTSQILLEAAGHRFAATDDKEAAATAATTTAPASAPAKANQ